MLSRWYWHRDGGFAAIEQHRHKGILTACTLKSSNYWIESMAHWGGRIVWIPFLTSVLERVQVPRRFARWIDFHDRPCDGPRSRWCSTHKALCWHWRKRNTWMGGILNCKKFIVVSFFRLACTSQTWLTSCSKIVNWTTGLEKERHRLT